MSTTRITLPDGSSWPRPSLESDDEISPEWRAIFAPENLTRGEILHLVSVSRAYRALVCEPNKAKALPAIRRALRKEATQ